MRRELQASLPRNRLPARFLHIALCKAMGVTPLELFGLDPRRGIPAWIAEDYLLLMEEQGKLADLRDQQERLRIAGERQRSSRR